jgi:hypothetical protein
LEPELQVVIVLKMFIYEAHRPLHFLAVGTSHVIISHPVFFYVFFYVFFFSLLRYRPANISSFVSLSPKISVFVSSQYNRFAGSSKYTSVMCSMVNKSIVFPFTEVAVFEI